MNEWTAIAIVFGVILLAAGLGALCDRLDTQGRVRGRKS